MTGGKLYSDILLSDGDIYYTLFTHALNARFN